MLRRFLLSVLGWLVLFGALLASIWKGKGAILFWDEHCYVGQARFIAQHLFDFKAYRALDFVRPPIFTGSLALLIRGLPSFGASIETLRLVTCAIGLCLLPLIFILCRQLGGRTRAAWLAVGLCAITPLYQAQIGLVLSDVPATVLTTTAWILLLRRRIAGFVIVSTLAVLTKESAYFLCAPTLVLLWWRGGRTLRVLWPAFWPGIVLGLWLIVHRQLVGQAIPSVNGAMVGITSLPEALLHNFIEGRLFLLMMTILALRLARPPQPVLELRATAVGIAMLPLMFPAPLPRYMLLSLPLLCVLSAIYLDSVSVSRLLGLSLFFATLCLIALNTWPLHGQGGYHLDAMLVYRQVQKTQTQAQNALAAEHPNGVLAHFPLFEGLNSGPQDGFARGPVPTTLADPSLTTEQLCRHRFLVSSRIGESVEAVRSRLATLNALRPWARFGEDRTEIVIYEIRCPVK